MTIKSLVKKLSLPFYLTKRIGFSKKKYWAIRAGGILLAFLAAGIVCTCLKPGSFGEFYVQMFMGCFDPTDITIFVDLLVRFSILLLISVILIPPFKMRFWNIGAEGQILVGGLVAGGIAKFAPASLPNIVVLLICLAGAMLASTIWSLIPTIFKAFFNTNETLFTLMMNYIASTLSLMMIYIWVPTGSQNFGALSHGIFPTILGNPGTLAVAFTAVIFAGMYLYITKGKHGYEVTVLGESVDTARYIGINVKKVTIRTMATSGALFGVVGFFIVCAVNQSFSATIVGGQGFTGVLIAWLGHFNPLEVALFAFLSSVMTQGTSRVHMPSSAQFSAICTGVFFFIIIACEFFSSYKISWRHNEKKEASV